MAQTSQTYTSNCVSKVTNGVFGAQTNTSQKYTVQPTGFGGLINRIFAVDPNRSTGIPINAQFRLPAPGAMDPNTYDDPVTIPAADIAGNPYWKRDVRRAYPQLSTVTQGDVVALLSVGSKAEPNEQVLQIGDAGKKQLVEVKQLGEKGLAAYLASGVSLASSVLGPDGLPPSPTPVNGADIKRYELGEQSYPSK